MTARHKPTFELIATLPAAHGLAALLYRRMPAEPAVDPWDQAALDDDPWADAPAGLEEHPELDPQQRIDGAHSRVCGQHGRAS